MNLSWLRPYTKLDSFDIDESLVETFDGPHEQLREKAGKDQLSVVTTRRTIHIALAVSSVIILFFIGAYGLRSTVQDKDLPHQDSGCGNSSAEAVLRGCSFDQLTWSWYPSHCPHYANDQFLNAEPGSPWIYYSDPYNKTQASGEDWAEAIDNKRQIWGQRREHLTHCVYMLLSLGQIIRDGTPYVPMLVSYEHLDHCSKVLLEALRQGESWHDVETRVPKIAYDQNC